MRYAGIEWESLKNGKGCRVVLFVQGCRHHCEGCQNPETWDPNGGKVLTDEVVSRLLRALDKPYIQGITFSGGDPLMPVHAAEVLDLSRLIKQELPDKDQWLYTGYTIQEVVMNHLEQLKLLSVIVTERFEQGKLKKHWAGSENQHVIDLKGQYPKLEHLDQLIKNGECPIDEAARVKLVKGGLLHG